MAKTYNQIKNSVLGKNYDINSNIESKKDKKELTYDEIKSGVKAGKYNFSRIKSNLESEIRFDTLDSDIASLGKTITDSYGGWQTQETMNNTRSSIESMKSRIGAYQEYQRLFGNDNSPDLSDLTKGYNMALDEWDGLMEHYGKYESANAYTDAIVTAKNTAKEYERKKNAYLPGVQKEIDELEGVLNTARKYQGNVKTFRHNQEYANTRSYGLTGNIYEDQIKKAENELKTFLKDSGFESVEDIENALGEKRKYYNQAEWIQKGIEMASVGDETSENYDKDFAENSKYTPIKEPLISFGKENQYDAIYKYINADERTQLELKGSVEDNGNPYLIATELEFMTDREKALYNYYFNTGGRNKAGEYFNTILEDLGNRKALADFEKYEGKWLKELGFGVYAGLDQFSTGMKNLGKSITGKEEYIPVNATQQLSGMIRQDLKRQGSDYTIIGDLDWGDIATTAYDFTTTTSNMMPSILTSTLVGAVNPTAGAVVGAGLMGASASGNAYQEMLNLGYDKNQARTYAAIVGVSEAGLQYALGGIGKLGGVSGKLATAVRGIENGFAKFAIRYGGSFISEGFEEGLQEVLNPLFMDLAAGYDTGEEINWEEVAYSALLGGLSGGLFGSVESSSSFRETKTNRAIGANIKANERIGEIFDMASISPEASSAYDTYTMLANKGISAENVSDYQLGLLATDMKADAEATIKSKKFTEEQRTQAEKTIADLDVYTQASTASRTGSAISRKKAFEKYDADDVDALIESGIESAEDTESFKLATEYKAKVKSGKKLTTTEIAKLFDANDQAIKAEETNDIATRLVELGESAEVADLVARKARGETLTTEEAEKVLESDTAMSVLAETSGASIDNSNVATEELLTTAKTMDKEMGALFVSLYDGNTDIEAYANHFNTVVAKAENGFGIDDLLSHHRNVLSGKQIGKIFSEVRIKADHMQRAKFQKLSEKTARLKAYKGRIDDSIIDYNNTSAKGKINWNDPRITDRMRKAITFVKGFAQATGINLELITDGKERGFNGAFVVDNNTIILDIFAGIEPDLNQLLDTIIPTTSHELTHWMENKSPVLYRKVSRLVFSTLQKRDGLTESERISSEIKAFEEKHPGKTMSVEEARSEIVARACEDMLSRSKVGREIFNSLSETEQKTLTDKIKEIIQNIKEWINDVLGLYKSSSYEARVMREYEAELDKLSNLWDEMLAESIEVNQALEKSGEFGRGTVDGKVLEQARKLQRKDPTKLTEEDFKNLLKFAKNKMFADNTFIPARIGTPQILIDFAKEQGESLENQPLAMNVYKVRQALSNESEWDGDYKQRPHDLSIDDIVEIIKGMDNPSYLVYQTKNDRLAEIVKFEKDGKMEKAYAIIDFFDVEKNPEYMNGYNGGKYNIVVTIYPSENSSELKEYLNNKNNIVITGEEMKKKATSQRGSGSYMPSHLNDIAFFNDSIPNPDENVKTKFSKIDSTGKELSKGQIEYFKDSAVRDENGSLKVMYRGDSSEFTVFDRKKTKHSNLYGRGFYFTDSKAHAEQYGNAREFYLDIKNPLSHKQNVITKKQMLNFLKAIENNGEDYDLYNYGQDATAESVLNSVWGKGDFEMIQDINAGAVGDLVAAIELFNEVNGTNYDGIILPTETITFNSEQAKLTSNLNPTKNTDIRFQMRENVEETKDLIAVHNLSPEKLLKTLKLGGLPMPSIAITRAREGWNNFGAISLVFGKDTIDPQFMRSNKVFSGDAWTPTYPRIEYKINEKVSREIREKINALVPKNIQDDLGGLHLDPYNLEHELNRHGEMVTPYRYNSTMKYAFLKDNNVILELPTKEVPLYRYGEVSNEAVISFAHKMVDGLKTVDSLLEQHSSKLMADADLINGIANVLNEEMLSNLQGNEEAYQQFAENPLYKPEDIDLSTVLGMLEASRRYFHSNGKIESKVDYKAARTLIDEKTDMAEYESWLKELFSDVIEKEGIRNNKDLFTPSGNRRSFEALHYEHTLENVIKSMKEEGIKGVGGFGGGNIFGASTTEYGSIDDIKSDAENRMQQLPESKYDEIKKGFSDRLFELAYSLPIHKDSFSATDDAANMLIEAVSKFKTKSGMANYLRTESKGWANYSDYIVDDLIELVNDIRNMPVSYFEAKPQRAVGYDEIKAVIMPEQSSYEDDLTGVKSELEKLGIPILEYEYGDNNARIKALNSLENVRFQRRDTNNSAPAQEFNEYSIQSALWEAFDHQDEGNDNLIKVSKMPKYFVNMFGIDGDFYIYRDHAYENMVSKEQAEMDGRPTRRSKKDIHFHNLGIDTMTNAMMSLETPSVVIADEMADGNPAVLMVLPVFDDTETPLYGVVSFYSNRGINGDFSEKPHILLTIHTKEYFETDGRQGIVDVINKAIEENRVVDFDRKKMREDLPVIAQRTRLSNITENSLDKSLSQFLKKIKSFREKNKILYQPRTTSSVYDIMGETERLQKENEKLRADVENLAEKLAMEKKVTGGAYLNTNQINVAAGHIRNLAKSNIDKVELMKALRDFYSYITESDELAWEDVFGMASRIADDVLAESKPEVIGDEYASMILGEIRNTRISLSETQKAEAQHRFGKNWNRNFFGRANITNEGIRLESQWQEWAEMYPDIFNADISESEMISELYDILGDLKSATETIAEYDEAEQTRWLAMEIYNTFWNISPVRTTADKYDKKIKLLNFEHRKAMKELRDNYNERADKQKLADDMFYGRKLMEKDKSKAKAVAEQRAKDKERYGDIIARIREQRENDVAIAKAHGKEMLDKYKDNAERKTYIQRITSNALSLNELFVKNSKDKHIPEIMRGPVASLLQAIDFSSKRMLEKGIPTQKDISLSKALSKVKDMMVKASNAHDELVELYGHGLDEKIEKMMDSVDNIMRTVGDNEFILNEMTVTDLQTLDKMVKTIKHSVNKLNKFHTVNHAKGIANLSQESMLYLDGLGNGNIHDGLRGKIENLLNWDNALPYYAFKRFGSGGIKVFEAMQDGLDKFAFNTKKIIDFANETFTSKEVKEWSEEVKTFNILIPASEMDMKREDYTPQYQEVQLTVPQIMSMYCLNKREQARLHLFQGGIRVADYKDAKGNIVSQADGIVFAEKDIQTIFDSLTERQKDVADKLQEFMNTVCTDWGNYVSMARFGYKAFGEENYFPIQSDGNNIANDEKEQINSLFKLLNMSFTKSTEPKANNRIVISDIFDVFAQHTSDMAKYNALALPVLDAFKWYNYTEKQNISDGTFKTAGVKQSIEKAFGKDGQNYFTTFLKDINGKQDVSRDIFGKGFFSNAKIAAVGANLRVVLLQPTSYARASAVIDNKYLTKALLHKPKIKKAETHCGIALWKSMGYYDTNIQRGVEAQIKHNDTWKDKAIEWAMKGAENADKLTWGYLWNACELEVRETRPDLKAGSQEFYDAISKRLRDVIYSTQVVDSIMTRSQIMRSTDGRDKMLTAFASEPTLSYNMLQDAYMEYSLDARRMGKKEAVKKNIKRIARVVYAYTMTNAIAALVESAFDAFREDDDEEMDMIVFMKLYFKNFAFDMSIGNKIPYIKDLYSLLQGYSSSRLDTQWVQYLYSAINTKKPSKFIRDTIRTASQIFGLPFYSIYRDTMALLNKLDLFTEEDLNEMFEDFLD